MKNRIPPEIDDLMWNVAEASDSIAIEEFGQRFPEHRAELGKRLSVLRSLRSSKPDAPAPRPLRIQNRRPEPIWKRFAVALAAVCIAVVGFAGVVYIAKSTAPASQQTQAVTPIKTTPFNRIDPAVRKTVPIDQAYHRYSPSSDPSREEPVSHTNPWEIPIVVKFDRVMLVDALQAIARQGHLELEIAPNMPQVEIGFAFEQNRPIAILEALGRQHGFSILQQGPGHVLVVPETKFSEITDDPNVAIEPANESTQPANPSLTPPSNAGN